MKSLKIGIRIIDTWFPQWGTGTLKTKKGTNMSDDKHKLLENFRNMKKGIRQDRVGFQIKMYSNEKFMKDSVEMVSRMNMLETEENIKDFAVEVINSLMIKLKYDLHEIKYYDDVLNHFIKAVHKIKTELKI